MWPTDGFTRPWPTVLCFVLGVSAVFTGIGAVGTTTFDILLCDDPASRHRVADSPVSG